MDAHLWPSLYPAIIVGLFVSFAFGPFGLFRMLAGACGGLLGGAVAYFSLAALKVGAGPFATGVTFLASAIVAWVLIKTLDHFMRSRSQGTDN